MITDDTLTQWGVLGMRWGVRKKSTHSTTASTHRTTASTNNKASKPKKISVKDLSDQELSDIIRRLDNEKRYNDYMKALEGSSGKAKAKAFVTSVLEKSGKEVASKVVTYALGKAINNIMKDTVINVGKDGKKKDD